MSATGKRMYASKTVNGTYKQAEQMLTADLRNVDTEQFIAPSKQTLSEYLDSWLNTTAKMQVATSTHINYTSNLNRVKAPLGHVKLDKLTPQMCQQFYSDLSDEGLSPRSIEAIHTTLKQALEQAVIWKHLTRNPTHGAARPQKHKVEAECFTAEESDLFLEAARKHPLWAMWLAFYSTGLRPQEMFAISWPDLQEREARVQKDGKWVTVPIMGFDVRRALKHVGKGQYLVKEILKTEKSRRFVSIPQTLVDALAVHKRNQAEAVLAAGPDFERNGYIFPNKAGRPLDVNNVRDLFHALCEISKVRKLKLYSLRHTHASTLLGAHWPLKIVSERLGHASIAITGDTYSHVMPEVEHETALMLDSLLIKSKVG
jgi:integrase